MSITMIENFRAAFYAPFYAACASGAYKAQGLDVRLVTSPATEDTIGRLLSGMGEVAWGGPMRLMQGLEKSGSRQLVAFCEVAGRDPFVLLGVQPNAGFRLADLVGPRVAVVMEVPTPWICLQHDLRLAGIDPEKVRLMPPRSMADNVAALRAGEVDVIQVFHPHAKALTQSGDAHVWYAAATRGLCSFTTLNTTRAFAEREPDTLTAMCRAMYRTQGWIATHDGAALAEQVATYFPDVPGALLAACYDDYRALGVWNRVPTLSREGFERMRDAALSCGRLQQRFDYDDVADMRFAERAMREDGGGTDSDGAGHREDG